MKKVLSWLLLCAMLLSLPLTVFAEDGGTSIPATNLGFRNGTRFYMYDPNSFNGNSGDTVFHADGEYISLNTGFKNIVTGAAITDGILQYREPMRGDYELSFDVVLSDDLKDRFFTMFYWQDYTENGRSMQTSTRGVGFALQTDIGADGTISFVIQQWESAEGKGTEFNTTTADSAPASSTALAGAQAGDTVNFHLQWKDNVLTVSATLSGNADATTGDVIYDLSAATAYLDAVKEPAGFALWMSLADGDTKSSRFGHFVLKDLEDADSAEQEIPIGKSAFLCGSTFYMYDPNSFVGASGDALFNCDGTYFSLNQDFFNMNTGAKVSSGVLQSRQIVSGDYRLSYEVVLNDELLDRIYTMFYWQDYTEIGRSMQTSAKGTGFALNTNIGNGVLTFSILKWMPDATSDDPVTAVAEGSAPASSDFLKDVAAGQALTFNLEWKDQVLTVSASKSDDPTATTGDVIFDLSGETELLSAVQDPAGFAVWLAPGDVKAATASKIGKFSLEALSAEALPADCWDYAVLNKDTFATMESGDSFVRGEDGWFTRSDDVATDVAAILYNKPVTYNYELTFNVRLNAENKGRVGIWNIWDGKFSGTHYGYMLVLHTVDDDTLEYRLGRYSPGYSNAASTLATEETKGNLTNSTILQGQPANAELLVKVVVQDLTMTVETCLASDPEKTMGAVVFDLSGDSETLMHRMVDRTLGFALIDMGPSIADGAGASTSIGNVTYRILPGTAPTPPEEEDNNDYNAILNNTDYAWSGDIACTEDNFKIYTMDGGPYEKFQIDENGWFYRTNENGDTTTSATAANAYAHAQYMGVMDSGDYRLSFTARLNEENRGRIAVMTRWDDANDQSDLMMKSQTGFRIYFRTEPVTTAEGEDPKYSLQIVCYQSDGSQYLPPMELTAGNADSDILQGLTEGNAELEITIVMKDDMVVAEAHLADDPSKTTGPVAFDLSLNANLLGKVDRTQGFLITDAACEYKIEPAAIGNIKLWAAAAPVVGEDEGEDQGDPDDNLPPVTNDGDDETPDQPGNPDGDETPTTTAPAADEEDGCKSSVSLSAAALAVLAVGAAATVGRRKKSDE